MVRRNLMGVALALILAGAGLFVLTVVASPDANVSGQVVLQAGIPAEGAWVRVQATDNLTYTAPDGSFKLSGVTEAVTVTITAWYPNYKVGWAQVIPPVDGVTITLIPYASGDNPAYEWNTSFPDPDSALGCGHCMLPSYDEWQHTAHAAAGTNPRFFSLYNGTDISDTIIVAPGYKLDFPGTAGNCATCHAPGAAYDEPFTTDMNLLSGVEQEGVFCEYCHKVGAVYLDPATGLPYNNTPGVLSSRLYRPYPDDQLFFGSLDDVNRRVSYLPLEKKSQFCAPCHQFSFWGTPIYESFREWLHSPYPAQGVECQTCHMPPGDDPYFALPETGGLPRNPARLASHRDLGLKDTEFMQDSVSMEISALSFANAITVSATMVNTGAGHHVPTDHPGRHMILILKAEAADGQPLSLLAGPRIPDWGGEQAGLPGTVYAKVLQDLATGQYPVINYWVQTRIFSDNRLPALGRDTTTYTFAAPAVEGPVSISAELYMRRTFQAEMQARGWNEADILMEAAAVELYFQPGVNVYMPIITR